MRAAVLLLAGAGAALAGVQATGCGRAGGDLKPELARLLEEGKLAEVAQRAQAAVDDGERSAWVQYYLGLALLRQNEDRRAEPALRAAVAADSTLGPALAEQVRAAAVADLAGNWRGRATSRMVLAYELDPRTQLGELLEPVAQAVYGNKEFDRALPLYRRLLDQGSGPEPKEQEWTFRLAYCLERTDRPDEALETYRGYLRRWTDMGGYKRRVMWRYQAALLDRAAALIPTQPAAALPAVEEALAPGWNLELLQRGRLLAGQALEALGRPSEALAWYAQALDAAATDKAGATYVEQARQRIEALRGTPQK